MKGEGVGEGRRWAPRARIMITTSQLTTTAQRQPQRDSTKEEVKQYAVCQTAASP
jgi:hypothetical protein